MAEPPTAPLDLAAPGPRDELLATKVNLPRTRPDRLARSRLVQRLDEGMGQPLVLVCTPAGFGKTTLLADWAADATVPVGWLSLDPDDNEPMRFWRYVVAALDRVVGGLGEQIVPLLGPGSGTSTHGVVTALINRLQDQPDELALGLDDYHLIDEPAIHDSFSEQFPLLFRLENRGPMFILGFALGCLLSSIYGFLAGAWPFGVLEAVWCLIAVRRYVTRRAGRGEVPA